MEAVNPKTGGLLALDIATKTGWAYGPVPIRALTALEMTATKPRKPVSGVITVQSTQSLGHFLSEFEERAARLFDRYQPAGLIIEAPILPKGVNFTTACKLMHMAGEAQKMAARRGISWVQTVQPASVKKHFTGNGRAQKPEIMAACDARGWTYVDDNEADAQAIWDLGCEQYRNGRRR